MLPEWLTGGNDITEFREQSIWPRALSPKSLAELTAFERKLRLLIRP